MVVFQHRFIISSGVPPVCSIHIWSTKMHKPDVPLRPIVSFYTSPTFGLSKPLVEILSPLVGKTSAVRNSSGFVKFTQCVTLKDEVLLSVDVISLFAKT